MILAGDIGATKTSLAYFSIHENVLQAEVAKSYPSRQHRSLGEIVKAFVGEHPAGVSAAAFGIAGPVFEGRSRLTNLGWDVDARTLASILDLETVGLLNDLEATAYGVLRLQPSDVVTLNAGHPVSRGAIAVIAAGTGLGEGGLVWDGTRYRAIPSEGGHVDFAPRNPLEIELLRYMLRKHKHVSCERLVSGPGLFELYQFCRLGSDLPEPVWLRESLVSGDPSAAVSEAALQRKDQVCEETLHLFVTLYGAEAGNLALKLLATGGVYVAGGIGPKIVAKLQDGTFLEAFAAKGRYESFLRELPVHVVLNERTALLGAAHFAATM